MTRRKKWFLFPLAGIAFLLILLVVFFDGSWIKGIVEDQASSALGRPVTIGELDVELGLVPRITARDVQVANAEWASEQPMARVPSATVEVDLLELIGGQLVLPVVAIEQPEVLLEQGEDRANWQFGGPDEPSEGGGPSIPVIGDLQVSGATVRYVDRVAGEEVVTTLDTVSGQAPKDGEIRLAANGALGDAPLELEVSAGSRQLIAPGGTPTPFEMNGKIAEQTIQISGEAADLMQAEALQATARIEGAPPAELLTLLGLEEDTLPPVDFEAEVARDGETLQIVRLDATLGASDLSGEGRIGLGEGPLTLTGAFRSNQVDVDQLRALWVDRGEEATEEQVGTALTKAEAALEQARSTAPAEAEDEAEETEVEQAADEVGAAAEQGLPTLPFSFDQLPPWTVDVSYQAGTIRAEDLTIENLEAEARLKDQIPALTAQADGTYGGQAAVLDVRLGPQDGVEASPFPVDAQIEAGETRLGLNGTIEQPDTLQGIELRFDAASQDLGQLLAAAGIEAPPVPAFEVRGRLIQAEQTIALEDFEGRVGESRVEGSASLDRSGETPLLTARIDAEQIRASDFMPGSEDQPDEQADAGGGTPMIENGRLNLAALPDLNLDVEFEGAVVELPDFRFEPLHLDLRVVDKVPLLSASGQGAFRDSPLEFEARLGDEGYLEDPSVPFPLDVRLVAGEARLTAEGTVAEPTGLRGLDVTVDLEGEDLDKLGDILQISLPSTPPFALAGELTHEGQTWTLDGLSGRVGDSTIDGRFSIDLGQDRPTIVADLHSEQLDFDDLAPLIGAPADTGEGETASPEQQAAAEQRDRLLPTDLIEVPDLKMMDARVQFRGENVDAPKLPLEGVTINLYLEDGKLRLEPVRFDLAGGTMDAMVELDATPRPMEGLLDIAVRNVDVQDLLGRFDIEVADIETKKEGKGNLFGRTRLNVRGGSIAEMLGQSDGQLSVLMDGGRVNALIVEAIGLDIGEALGLLVSDDGENQQVMVPVNCLVADFSVEAGVMKSKALVLDTEDSKIVGAGTISLAKEQFDLRFKALPRDNSVLSAGTPVKVEGSFTDPQIELVSGELVEKGFAAAALGVLLPVVGAVIPFIEMGEEVPNNCSALLEQASQSSGAATPATSSN